MYGEKLFQTPKNRFRAPVPTLYFVHEFCGLVFILKTTIRVFPKIDLTELYWLNIPLDQLLN